MPEAIREPVAEAVRDAFGAHHTIRRALPLSGGCISHALRLDTTAGASAFLKYRLPAEPGAGMFQAEADSLRALDAARALRVPAVLGVADASASWVLLEWLEPRPPSPADWRQLGRGLAQLHATRADRFGWNADNFIGSLPQANAWHDDWAEFWDSQRLTPRFHAARAAGLLNSRDEQMLDALRARLPALLEPAAADGPSLLHGDLWAGNVHVHTGGPAVVDPSSYYGHGEVDLAMAGLFGGFPPEFYASYTESRPLTDGHELRRAVYQLYYLLVHVELFGVGYVERTRAALRAALA